MAAKRKPPSILDYFGKKLRTDPPGPSGSSEVPCDSASTQCCVSVSGCAEVSRDSDSTASTCYATGSNSQAGVVDVHSSSCFAPASGPQAEVPAGTLYKDIGEYFPSVIHSFDDHTKLLHFQKLFVPDSKYKFPTTHKGKQQRKSNANWLEKYCWLSYSPKEDGAYCKYCVFFSNTTSGKGKGSHQNLGALVTKHFSDWKHSIEAFNSHANTEYHKAAVVDGDNFVYLMGSNKIENIQHRIDRGLAEQVEKNRKRLIPIVEAIVLCGRQEIALRGHVDYGQIEVDKNNAINSGNFRAILKYRAKGDEALRAVLEGPGSRNKYISPGIQNQIISCINDQIVSKIVRRVNDSQCFAVLADETADIAGIEQLSLCVRYVSNLKLHEDFLQFIPVSDVTGKGLAKTIIESLLKCGINVSFLRGQGYDGAASMSGKLRGAQALILRDYPMAVYCHCAAHNFNLVVSDACGVAIIRNALGTMDSVRTFFQPPKRKHVLNTVIESTEDLTARSLKRLTLTRWLERLHGGQHFRALYKVVLVALEKVQEFDNRETSRDALALFATITRCEFIVAMIIISQVFALGEPICRQFQRPDIDLSEVVNIAGDLKTELLRLRSNAESDFKRFFSEAEVLAESNGVAITMPRISGRQLHRVNPSTHDVQSYYRVSVYIPFLDAFIESLDERFIKRHELFTSFRCLLPKKENLGVTSGLDRLYDFYSSDPLLGDLVTIDAELKLFYQRLSRLAILPRSSMESIQVCDQLIYPNVFRLLQLLATLPVSTATNERSFSTLKRLKTYLRNSTSENRLNGLASMSIHRDEEVNVQTVIDDLARMGSRRLNFVL